MGYEEEELVTPVTRAVTVTSSRRTVETEENLSPPLFVTSAVKSELQDGLTGNATQNNTDIPSEKVENSELRSSVRLGTAKPPVSYGAVRYW